jgi:DNA-binding NtrC family response regulator
MEAILTHDWPGNVRELQNVLRRYFTLRSFTLEISGDGRTNAEAPVTKSLTGVETEGHRSAVEHYEKTLIEDSLKQHQWHREKAAASLGMARRTFFRKMKKFGFDQHK